MLRVEVPVKNGWYLPMFDEIFLGFPPNYGARPFDQNRLFFGVGKSLGGVNVEAGYMNQLIGQRNGRIYEFNNTLWMGISSNVPLARLIGR
jgi:hypothetical protein